MSYCRLDEDSDVYMYSHIGGFIECCVCKISNRYSEKFDTSKDALDHLYEHIEAGHKVPEYALKRLREEIK